MKKVICFVMCFVFVICGVAYCGEKEELELKKQLIIVSAEKLQLQQAVIQQQFRELQEQLKDVDSKLKKYETKKEEKKK